MKFRILVLLVLICLVASLAEAQTRRPRGPIREGRWDFGLQTRYTASKDFTGEGGSSLELQDDLGWGFGFGYNLNDRFNLGMAFTWRSVNYNAVGVDAEDPDVKNSYSGQLSTSTIGFTGDWNILDRPITPYVNGGIGWMLVDTNIFAGYTPGCWWDPWWGYVCGNFTSTYGTTTTVFTAGAGARFHLSESLFARVGYERGWSTLDGTSGTNILRIDLGLMN